MADCALHAGAGMSSLSWREVKRLGVELTPAQLVS
jgi:hypothetical protein